MKSLTIYARFVLLASLWPLTTSISLAQSEVSAWEAPMAIPTYGVGAPDPEPMLFLPNRNYQGAWGAIYPYGLYDNLLGTRSDKTYQAAYLENKFVKITVLPELGGRVLSATDKSDGYDYVYRQDEIRPALIGMLGAWISGGMEWNIPHHHRATSYLPVDHRLVKNADGSSTIWVGELELRHRMEWAVAITLYPDRSYIKVTTTLVNRTPFVQSFLDFTNTSVHANENYQVIFPPDTQFAVFHAKVQFAHWPESHEVYQGVDYTRGVDLSWWKNHPTPVSFFAWNFDGDFFGGYDHGKDAGTISIQDHTVSPGAKFFEWGNGPQGKMWDKILDSRGDYLELMAGNFSDNQPDYSWIEPTETKTATQYWYPIRGIGGAKNANLNGALNLEVDKQGKAHLGFSATQEFPSAKVVLSAQGKAIFEQTADLGPTAPFVREAAVSAGVAESDLKLAVLDSNGKELVSYVPVQHEAPLTPPVVIAPAAPSEIKTVDELYRVGLRLEQFHSTLRPDAYFAEALRRDPGNYDVNTAVGRMDCERGLWLEAAERLNAALDRATHNYTRPKDGEAYYYLGVALVGAGKSPEAEDAFHRASWSEAWTAASYLQLAQLAGRNGQWAQALADIEQSLAYAAHAPMALDLKAALLRRLGRTDEALQVAYQALNVNALDLWAAHEIGLAHAGVQPGIDLGNSEQSNLELALDYINSGMSAEAKDILKSLLAAAPDKSKANPLIYYYLGYLADQAKKAEDATVYFKLAAQMPPDYVFPFRLEEIEILRVAMRMNPADAHAPYYLGNLLYDLQPSTAIRAWERAAAMDPHFAMVRRNIALGYQQTGNDIGKAIKNMEEAVALDRSDARFLYELDTLNEAGNIAPAKRLAVFESNPVVASRRPDVLAREARLYLLAARPDDAIHVLKANHFHNWEGEEDIHNIYMDACLMHGEKQLKAGRAQDALRAYEASLEYPENLEVARPYHESRLAEVDYWMGRAYTGVGNKAKALELYRQASGERGQSEMLYYRGLAAQELGRSEEAGALFNKLMAAGQQALHTSEADFFAKFGQERSSNLRLADGHYLIGLGYLGKGDATKARGEFEEALKLNASHLGATKQLAALAELGTGKVH